MDSKFGAAVETGQAMELVKLALAQPHLKLLGLHCHVGSQVFGEDVYQRTIDIMAAFLAEIRDETGAVLEELNLGGGYGVRYTEEDEAIDIPARLREVALHLRRETEKHGLPMPRFLMEPGRSIVADAGMTLYTVGSIKRIPGYKQYAAVDGGMTDNPRYALYQSRYTVYHGSKTGPTERFDVVGRCCESGDIIQPHDLDFAAVALEHIQNEFDGGCLAGAVWPDDAGDALAKGDLDFIGKALEALDLQFLKYHPLTFPL